MVGDRHVSSRSITQELKIDHKRVLSQLSKAGFKKKLDPNIKLRSLLSTTGPFEASDWPEMARIGEQKRCCAPSGQRQAIHFCSDPTGTLGAWLRSFNASTI
ncbi:hypothetical protein TNCV_1770751 [Trichonephila clavipes]|nr:hypothetical protein TNCV_1770751 [Trichonephila clavipes]